jgi:hypothetical protein
MLANPSANRGSTALGVDVDKQHMRGLCEQYARHPGTVWERVLPWRVALADVVHLRALNKGLAIHAV